MLEFRQPPANRSFTQKEAMGMQDHSWIQDQVMEWLNTIGFSGTFPDGARFNDPNAWWDDQPRRLNPHEGIDVIVPGQSEVFPVFPGSVVSIIPKAIQKGDFARGYDYIANTVVVAHHAVQDSMDRILVSLYGHIKPATLLVYDSPQLERHDLVGHVALTTFGRHPPSHLHFSLGWAKPDQLMSITGWNELSVAAASPLELFDPLPAQKQSGQEAL